MTEPPDRDLRRPQSADNVEYKQPTLPSHSSAEPVTDEGWVHPAVGGCFLLAGPLGWLFLLIRYVRYQGGKRFHTPTWEKVVAGIIATLLALNWINAFTHAFTK